MGREERTHSQKLRFRMRLIGVCLVLAFAVLSVRAFQIQVLDADRFTTYAKRMHLSQNKLTFKRGPIFDRRGVELAISMEADSVFVDPALVEDKNETARMLADSLGLSKSEILKKLDTKRRFVWVDRLAPDKGAGRLREAGLKGVGFIPESKRHYPMGNLAVHVLGFVGHDCRGLEGLELRYNDILKGTPGYLLGKRDARGDVFFPDGVQVRDSEPGGHLELTLDGKIQFFTEQALDEAMRKTSAKGAVAIVMNPRTGDVLAMASRPDFNPNRPARSSNAARRNRAVTDVFEPGSTFKSFLLGAALEEGLPRENSKKVYCEEGRWRFGGRTIHDTHSYKWLTLPDIIRVSSNIGSAKLAATMGADKFYQHIRRFGFGQKTGIRLVGEVPGLLSDPSRWSKVGLATRAFGQGIAVTPIQLLNSFNALVNGGNLMRPQLVRKVVAPGGEVVESHTPSFIRRVVSRETSHQALDILVGVVEDGTGKNAAISGFRVAGKTGTAQKVDPQTRSYHPTARVASFIGCVPADDPILSILVVVDEPQGKAWERYGGSVAAPAFRQIAVQSLNYLGVFPERSPETARVEMPRREVKPTPAPASVKKRVVSKMLSTKLMPDLQGLSMRTVLKIAEERRLNLTVVGTGSVISQEPKPGTLLHGERRAKVVFAPPT